MPAQPWGTRGTGLLIFSLAWCPLTACACTSGPAVSRRVTQRCSWAGGDSSFRQDIQKSVTRRHLGDDVALLQVGKLRPRQAASVRAGTGTLASDPAGLGLKLPPGLQASVPDDIFEG